ncbi:hypothetical protein [Streptomyces sp. sk2.1]|nr:hypothetical protein [Streptomyces sp. sk2.1]
MPSPLSADRPAPHPPEHDAVAGIVLSGAPQTVLRFAAVSLF